MAPVLERTSPVQLARRLTANNELNQEKEAFAIVYTLILVSVARIAFVRHLFPEQCFTIKDPSSIRRGSDSLYDRISGLPRSASDYNGEAGFTTAGNTLEILERHQSTGADQLLDWLEVIFEAVIRCSLEGFQLSIYADRTDSSRILESYTFSFQYCQGAGGANSQLAGLTGPDGTSVTVEGARSGLKKILDQLHNYHEILPDLPRERYLICHLFYPPDHVHAQQPPGFQACSDIAIVVPEGVNWHLAKRNFGAVNAGVYRTGLKIAFMALTSAAERSLEDHLRIPENMEYTRALNRTFDLQRHPVPPKLNSTQLPERRIQASQQSFSPGESPLRGTEQEIHSGAYGKQITTGQKRSYEETEPRYIKMDSLSEDELVATQLLVSKADPLRRRTKARLLRGKALDMRVKKSELEQKDQSVMDANVCRCQCGFNHEEGPAMLQCECCGTWQHLHCYGFIVDQPGDEHYCYQCLLEDSEQERLAEMRELARFRRALWMLYDRDDNDPTPYTQISLAGKLSVDSRVAAQLTRRLKDEGFLTRGRTSWPVKTAAQVATRHRVYGDPFTSVRNKYEIPEDAAAPKIQVEDVNSGRKRAKVRKSGARVLVTYRAK